MPTAKKRPPRRMTPRKKASLTPAQLRAKYPDLHSMTEFNVVTGIAMLLVFVWIVDIVVRG